MIEVLEGENILEQIPPLQELTGEEVFYMSEQEYLELIEYHECRFQFDNGKVTPIPYAKKTIISSRQI